MYWGVVSVFCSSRMLYLLKPCWKVKLTLLLPGLPDLVVISTTPLAALEP